MRDKSAPNDTTSPQPCRDPRRGDLFTKVVDLQALCARPGKEPFARTLVRHDPKTLAAEDDHDWLALRAERRQLTDVRGHRQYRVRLRAGMRPQPPRVLVAGRHPEIRHLGKAPRHVLLQRRHPEG